MCWESIAGVNWSHRFSQRLFLNLGYQFSRLATHVTPYFENRENVSGEAGITGNNQEPMNWGPPSLVFSSGIAGLSDGQSSFDRNQTSAVVVCHVMESRAATTLRLGAISAGRNSIICRNKIREGRSRLPGGYAGNREQRPQRGLRFRGFSAGNSGHQRHRLRQRGQIFSASPFTTRYITDDWRISPQFTLNAGVRWEYGAPITELYGRLVNLDIAPGFAAAAPGCGKQSGRPADRQTISEFAGPAGQAAVFEPRVGIAWRPISGSSMVVRAGYGIYYDTSVYQTIAIADGAAAAAVEELERAKQPGVPAHAGEWIHHRVPRSRPTRLPSIRISASAMRRTGRCRCSATCPARCK